jgi:hypothetical protein
MRAPVLAALFLAFLPGCIIAGRNSSQTHDVEKPPSDPPIPESVYKTVEFDAAGLSEPVYEAPQDRAFVVRDLRVSVPVNVLVELAGVPAVEQIPALMFEGIGSTSFQQFRSPAGLKIPPSAKLRLQRFYEKEKSVSVFAAGDLVRM